MNAFVAAIDDLFANPDIARTVLYRSSGVGDGVAVRVIARRPDREVAFGDIAVQTSTALFEVRVAEVANPAEGDSITLDGETFIVQGEPERDADRLIWLLDTRPA
ncbi:conserved hypothetical protein [Rhodospirillaceae bacterium LM-1]|nr:conserved hypothetical protein [Rhodospirillaceae bacterium LM-1]